MENEKDKAAAIQGFARWAITPPQSYALYLICLFTIAGVSFYVGTLNAKKAGGIGPPQLTAPRS